MTFWNTKFFFHPMVKCDDILEASSSARVKPCKCKLQKQHRLLYFFFLQQAKHQYKMKDVSLYEHRLYTYRLIHMLVCYRFVCRLTALFFFIWAVCFNGNFLYEGTESVRCDSWWLFWLHRSTSYFEWLAVFETTPKRKAESVFCDVMPLICTCSSSFFTLIARKCLSSSNLHLRNNCVNLLFVCRSKCCNILRTAEMFVQFWRHGDSLRLFTPFHPFLLLVYLNFHATIEGKDIWDIYVQWSQNSVNPTKKM